MNIVLIGLRGTGKTVCGRLLAERLGWRFVDTDDRIQERAGKSIREIFSAEGEAWFRRREAEAVREIAAGDQMVIATGGGAVLDPGNVAAMRDHGFVVHLAAHPETLWKRVAYDTRSNETRPPLGKASAGLEEMLQLFRERAGAYCAARDVEVSVEDRTPEQIVAAILLLLRVRGMIA